MKNSVVDFNYYMLLRKPWFRDATVTHDCDNNVNIVRGNGTIITISVNKKLGVEVGRPQILVCYELMEGLTDKKEDLILKQTIIILNWHNYSLNRNNFVVECWSVKN